MAQLAEFIQTHLGTSGIHLSLILIIFFITYVRILARDIFWVIDDLDGIARFSERWVQEKDPSGAVTKEYKIDSYEIGEGDKKKTVKFLSFIPELGFPGCVLRFLRLHIGKEYRVIGRNAKGHEVWGYVQSPRRHHILSMFVQACNLVLGYTFLSRVLPPDVAFVACALYGTHPLTTQSVAWISGINYSFSMFWALATINLAYLIPSLSACLPIIAVTSFLSGITLYIGCFTWVILLFLGFKWQALISAVIGLAVLYWKGSETKKFRTDAFKEQNMHKTTFLNWRKPIVMVKTLWYYFAFSFLPIRMGLYHVWGYFYEDPMERINGMFWRGIAVLSLIIACLIYAPFAIKLGIVWYLAYFFLFSNFITAQQFVADRYITVPSFGICIILASIFHSNPIVWIILGLYAMRTLLHLDSFRSEIDFYISNFHNFRNSEVSLGNLGVSYMNNGMPGSAVDTWLLSTKINPHYDVAWYNLYSLFRANGRFQEAHTYLKNCLNAKVVHFEKRWRDELVEFEKFLQGLNQPQPMNPQAVQIPNADQLHNPGK